MNFHPTNATQLWKLKLGDELPCHREELEGTVRGTVTLHYSRYLRLLSSSKVRSTTSAGAAHVCCGVTAVHDCAGREPTYCVPEPCFQEATLWITPPRGWTHLQLCEEYRPVSLPWEWHQLYWSTLHNPIVQVHDAQPTSAFLQPLYMPVSFSTPPSQLSL